MDVWVDGWMGEYLGGCVEHNAEGLKPQCRKPQDREF